MNTVKTAEISSNGNYMNTFQPEKFFLFYYVDADMHVNHAYFNPDDIWQRHAVNAGNAFELRVEAEKAAEYLKEQLKQYHELHAV